MTKICKFEGCNNTHSCNGYCNPHARQFRKQGFCRPLRKRMKLNHKCSIDNCNEKHEAKGCCQLHYERLKRFGNPRHRTVFDKNEIIDKGSYVIVKLYNNKSEQIGQTFIDKDDYEKYFKDKRIGKKNFYATIYENQKTRYIHTIICKSPKYLVGDHINGDTFDNRKQNLRVVGEDVNASNRRLITNGTVTNMIGVNKGKYPSGRIFYVAKIIRNRKCITLGKFPTIEQARYARMKAEDKYGYISRDSKHIVNKKDGRLWI